MQSIQIQNQKILQGQYIQLEMEGRIYGGCQNMISDQENWRSFEKYQTQPYMKIAKHFRNIQYTSQNTRTLNSLKKTLNYIYNQFVPILEKLFKHSDQHNLMKPQQLKQMCEKRNTFLTFIYDRLKAIRCEYYIQGVVYPSELIKIVRLEIVIQTFHEMILSGDGLERMISFEDGDGMLIPTITAMQHFKEEYVEALSYGILVMNRNKLTALIENHEIILENKYLRSILELRVQIDNGNYYRYFEALENHENPIIKCILWSRVDEIRQIVTSRVQKSRMNVEKSWVGKIMSWKIEDGWIQGGKINEYYEANKKNIKYILLGIRCWASIEEICQYLMKNQKREEDSVSIDEPEININQPLNTSTMAEKNKKEDIVDDEDW